MPKPESVFRIKVLAFIKTLKHTKVFPIQQLSISGTPDLLLCIRGWFVGLELKSTVGKPTPLQDFQLKDIEKCGGIAMVASPFNWPHIKERLKQIDEGEDHG